MIPSPCFQAGASRMRQTNRLDEKKYSHYQRAA
uniref:Uncharacterized protein n=1 Tax=Myoviridae sp. ctGBP5 TaxID=2825071 RepID=A0A8S5PAG3_9CAUD|nr:MAG TPA: hypothetical protein [Myoviridae sp. ctGBP5]